MGKGRHGGKERDKNQKVPTPTTTGSREAGNVADASPAIFAHFQVAANFHANVGATKVAEDKVEDPLEKGKQREGQDFSSLDCLRSLPVDDMDVRGPTSTPQSWAAEIRKCTQ